VARRKLRGAARHGAGWAASKEGKRNETKKVLTKNQKRTKGSPRQWAIMPILNVAAFCLRSLSE